MPFWHSSNISDSHGAADTSNNSKPDGISLPKHEGKKHLPQPCGPHSVGFVDIMTPDLGGGAREEGVFVRVLYPTKEQCLERHERWPYWMEDEYLGGMLDFAQKTTARWPSWAPTTEYLGLNAFGAVCALIPKLGFASIFKAMNGHIHTPIIEAAVPDDRQQWPLVVFSHGLGCCRGAYSRICYDIASYGFIVAAVEHRDGSGCLSYHHDPHADSFLPVHHRSVSHGRDEYAFRNAQVKQRAAEVGRTLDVMLQLATTSGEIENVWPQNFKFDFTVLGRVMDVAKPVITGHSFGGATTVLSLAQDDRFAFGIALDAWLFPLMKEDVGRGKHKPIMFINTESFMSRENVLKMSEFRMDDNLCERKFHYIRGSVHQNQLDVPFIIYHSLLRRVVGVHSDTCPEIVMDLNNKLMVQFLRQNLGLEADAELEQDIEKNKHLLADPFKPWDQQ